MVEYSKIKMFLGVAEPMRQIPRRVLPKDGSMVCQELYLVVVSSSKLPAPHAFWLP